MTARDDFASKHRGYHIGIDDYMIKPVDLDELFLRIGALLRRAKIANSHRLEIGSLTLDADSNIAPKAALRLLVSNTAKVMYARMLDAVLTDGIEDVNRILFIRFPMLELSAALSCSHMTVKRSLEEQDEAGLIVCPSGRRGTQQDMYSKWEKRLYSQSQSMVYYSQSKERKPLHVQ